MKNYVLKRIAYGKAAALFLAAVSLGIAYSPMTAHAAGEETIKKGVTVEGLDLGGMTKQEAKNAIEFFLQEQSVKEITLKVGGGNTIVTTPGALGMTWENPEILDEAILLGTEGNVIQRYKAAKDLEHNGMAYDLELTYNEQAIHNLLVTKGSIYDQKAVNYTMTRENGEFVITDGQTGYALDVDASEKIVYDYLMNDWDYTAATLDMDVEVVEPKGSREELASLTDVLGTYTTSYRSSGSSRSNNVSNGCSKVNGILMYPGDEFSMLDNITPFTSENGYYLAGSYLNGQVVDSFGGGICQVSTTLYNAVLLAELDVTQRTNHSLIVNYVDPSMDAAIAESSGKDFKFKNNTEYPIYIDGHTSSDKKITFTIYGVETRDTVNRKVSYESEVIEKIYPESDTIYTSGNAFGYIVTSSAHIGYKARLWKIVTENGVEVSREVVNNSKYNVSPRSATVGTATDNADAYNALMAAVASGSIDQCKAVIAAYTVPTTPEVGDQ